MLHILLADDHQVAITGLSAAINGLPDFKVIAQTSGGKETLRFLGSNAVDVVVTDLYMNDDDLNGIELTLAIKKKFSTVKVLMFSGEDKKSDILLEAFQASKVIGGLEVAPLASAASSVPHQKENEVRRAKILLVEDNHVNQRLAVKLLEKAGHFVTTANNGREACEKVEQEPE